MVSSWNGRVSNNFELRIKEHHLCTSFIRHKNINGAAHLLFSPLCARTELPPAFNHTSIHLSTSLSTPKLCDDNDPTKNRCLCFDCPRRFSDEKQRIPIGFCFASPNRTDFRQQTRTSLLDRLVVEKQKGD
uniref:Uncharacterized protein n=1 Tax=Grammatophora oceanica TaxID=210454 RepID=A0A7S1VUJ3_9STRA